MNSPIKQRLIAEWIKNHNPIICCLQETHLKWEYRVKVKGWRRIYCASADVKKAGVAILISDKAKADIDLIKREKKEYYILPKGTIENEAIS